MVMSFTLLRHVLLVQGILLVVILGLFLAHGLWLAWYEPLSLLRTVM